MPVGTASPIPGRRFKLNCIVCEERTADTQLKVSVSRVLADGDTGKVREYRTVPVPVCSECKAQELSRGRSSAVVALIIWGVLVALGALAAGWQGAGAGFAFGFLISIVVNAVKKPSKALQYDGIKVLEQDGYRASGP